MDNIRLFLECNKIFFEVFSYTIVGIAGIIFSRYQYKSNKRQNEMQKAQIEMQNKEFQPIFMVRFRIDSYEEKNDSEHIELYNEGKPFRSFNYEIRTFFKLRFSSFDDGINSTYYVPISDFYFVRERYKDLTGKLWTNYVPNNHAKFCQLYTEAIELSKDNKYIFINRFSLIQIEYTDIYNNKQTVYFEDELQINKNIFIDIVEKSEEVFKIPFNIEEVQLAKIRAHIKSLNLPVF